MGGVPLSSSGTGSCVEMEAGIGDGKAVGCYDSVLPPPSPSIHSINIVVGCHGATDNDFLENEATSLGSVRTKVKKVVND